VEQQPLPEGARERFLKKIASSPAVKPQEKLAEVTPISVKSARRGPGFWIPWVAAAAMAIVAISLGVQNRALNDELQGEVQPGDQPGRASVEGAAGAGSLDRAQRAAGDAYRRQSSR
jgi:hypothetical protein